MKNGLSIVIAFASLLTISVFGIAYGNGNEADQGNGQKLKIFHGTLGTDESRKQFEDKINGWLNENSAKILPSEIQQSNLGKFSTQANLIYLEIQNGPKIRVKVFTGSPTENDGFLELEKQVNDWLNQTKTTRFRMTQSSSDNYSLDLIVWYELKN